MKKSVIAGLVGILTASVGEAGIMVGDRDNFIYTNPVIEEKRIGEPIIFYADTTYSSAGHFSENDFEINKAYPFRKKVFTIHTREGDCLDEIAQELSSLLHRDVRWPGLYAQNKEIIGPNPHHIPPDMILHYNAGWEEGTFVPNKVGMIAPS
jgi:hypothetical protein